jgi:bacteriocin-like protein
MKRKETFRGLFGKRREDTTSTNTPTPAQPADKVLTEQELEQVQGGRMPDRRTIIIHA